MQARLPAAYRYDVALRRPVLLPGHVRAGADIADDGSLTLGVVSSDAEQTHLVARVRPA